MERTGNSRMILLNEVAKKIEDILNGIDSEVVALGLQPPTSYFFKVATEGFHIDKNFDIEAGKNFIPVFISSMGGNFNPVPELLQANYVIPIAIYFPVRFKTDLFRLNEYLARVFVGRQLNYGTESGKALSNMSVAQFGEIVEMDLKQFAEWEQTIYKKPIERMEPYLQMQFSLYLSTASEEFVFGNDAKASLTITTDDATWPNDDKTDQLSFVQNSVQSNSEPGSQQILGENQTESLPSATSFSSSFSVYVKNNAFYQHLISHWFAGTLHELEITLSFEFIGQTYTKTCFVQGVNLGIQKGELSTITLTFLKKADVNNGGL